MPSSNMAWILILSAVFLLTGSESASRPESSIILILWQQGDHGIPSYRVPIVSHTPQGNLIVISEGRKTLSSDVSPKYHVMRRSTDGGNIWSTSEIILKDDSPDGMSLGSIIVDDTNSIMHMLMVKCAHYFQCETPETYHRTSHDDGLTWSFPRSLNSYLGDKVFYPGPGTGIQKKFAPHVGRLLACGHSTLQGNGLFVIFSDDNGDTWHYGGSIKSIPYNAPKVGGDFVPDECQLFELDDGSIVVNIRNLYQYHCNCRMITRSYDGGANFNVEDLYFDEVLVDPSVCAGANVQNGILYFSNPHHGNSRQNLQLTWSYDQGSSWESDRLVIWSKKAANSVIAVSPHDKKHIFMVYERGVLSDAEEIVFHKLSVEDMGNVNKVNVTQENNF